MTSSKLWMIPAARGMFALALGLAALAFRSSQQVLVNYMGVYWLLGSILVIRWAVRTRWTMGARIGVAAGIIGIVAASLILTRKLLETEMNPELLLNIVAGAVVLIGVLRLAGAFELERQTGRRWTFGGIALGSVEIAIGVALFVVPAASDSLELRSLIAVWGFVGGTLLLLDARALHAKPLDVA